MTDITIYHNPACVTSLNLLALILNTVDFQTVVD